MQYEIIDKATEVCYDATLVESNTTNPEDIFTLVRREDTGEIIRFENDNASGELINELYIIRDKDTHTKADGTGTVEIAEAGITDSEGVVAPAEVVADDVVAETTTETVAEEVAPTVAE